MNYLNITVSDLASDNFISATLEQRGAWIGLLRYCAVQENGGEIVRCQHWRDIQWMQACGISEELAKAKCSLWSWEGDCLRVFGYPWDNEQTMKKKRAGGKKGAEARWSKAEKPQPTARKYELKPSRLGMNGNSHE